MSTLVLAAATVLVGVGAATVSAAPAPVAARPTPPVAARTPSVPAAVPAQVESGAAVRTGRLAGSQQLRLTLGIAPPHPEQETQFLDALQTKGSLQFHHYLTPEQYTARFGPSVQSEAAVVQWARANGLTVTQRFPDRLLVDVEGTAATIEAAFGVQLVTYRVGAETDFSNDRPAVIPPALTGVLANVEGLNDIQRYRPLLSGQATGPGVLYAPGPARTSGAAVHGDAPAGSAGPAVTHGGTDPNDLDSAQGYDYGALYRQGHCCNPTGAASSPPQSSIDLIGFGTVDYSDIASFSGEFGLAYSVSGYNIDGTPPTTNDDDNLEDTLDIEYATATANSFGAYQNTSHITEYYVANFASSTFTDAYNFMYSDGAARTMSASYGGAENDSISGADMDTNHGIFNSMVGTGWTLFASSGDHGSYTNCSSVSVSYPASDPDVLAVGGTSLALASDGSYSSETAWSPSSSNPCDNNTGGSGGGCSAHFAAPGWQSSLDPCGTGSRAMPDIALNSATQTPQHLYWKGSAYYTVWGTSIASPEMAGFNAQEDAYLLSIGHGPDGAWATNLWFEGQHPTYAPHYPLYDITSGCNYWSGQSGYCAHTGYDLVTGWGSANMLQLAWMLNWFDNADVGRPAVTFSGPTTGRWYDSDQSVSWTVADSGGGQPATGVAGFTQGWDTVPGDATSVSHQGSGNAFWDGPQFPNATSGYLELAFAGSGCHVAYVEAWDNMGLQSGAQPYGRLCYDPTTPYGDITINGGHPATNSRTVSLSLNAFDYVSGDPIQYMRFATNNGSYGAWQSYSNSASYTLPAGEGGKNVHVEFLNAAGTVSSPASAPIVLDTTAPVIGTAPTVTIAQQPLGSGSGAHLKVTWAGSDGAHGSGVKSYTLQESVDGGNYSGVSLPTAAATSVVVAAPAGHTYQFRVKATDAAGNSSALRAGRLDTLKLVQESGSAVSYSGGWSRTSVAGSSGGTVETSTHHGNTATLHLSGIAVALVTDIASGHGTATLSLDGGATTSVTTSGSSLKTGQVLYSRSFGSGSHTLVLTNTGSGSASRFDLDAFLVLS